MPEWQNRTLLMLGEEKLERLAKAHVLAVGLGGVGAVAAEMICRAGVGRMTIIDGDTVDATNRNRQLPALISTLGKFKGDVVGARLMDINSSLQLTIRNEYLKEERIPELFETGKFDCVLDAIDTLAPKIHLSRCALEKGIPVVSSMGAGARLDPEKILCADISKTYNCSLARAFRQGLVRLGIRKGILAVFSTEPSIKEAIREATGLQNKRSVTGTISYMPALFGCHCAAAVIRILLAEKESL